MVSPAGWSREQEAVWARAFLATEAAYDKGGRTVSWSCALSYSQLAEVIARIPRLESVLVQYISPNDVVKDVTETRVIAELTNSAR